MLNLLLFPITLFFWLLMLPFRILGWLLTIALYAVGFACWIIFFVSVWDGLTGNHKPKL